MNTRIAFTNKGSIEYSLKGNGPVILVMHGMSQDCNADLRHDAFIQSGFSMLTPSRPGYGKTPAATGDTAAKAAEAIAALLDHLKVDKANVMAVSGGGPTALYLAANYPDKVKRLALVEALSKPWQDKARYETVKRFYGPSYKFMWLSLRVFSSLFPAATAKRTISLFSTHDASDLMKHLSKDEVRSLLRLFKSKAYTAGPLIDLGSPPDVQVLRRIAVPTLVVHTKEDKSVEFDNAEYSTENIASSRLFVSPTWSHFPWLGPHGDEQLQEVINFFKRAG